MKQATAQESAARAALPSKAREAMEKLNAEAAPLNIWLRTQANAPAQRPWYRETEMRTAGDMAAGRVAAGQLKARPHRWRWREISPYLTRIADVARSADVPPVEFADRQQFLLTNPGLGGRLQVSSTMRCAVSIYNPADVAGVHVHTPNASRTILSENGGYTTVDGERCVASRGDLILTPHGTWHDHGNDSGEPVMWMDVLDWPLMEFLDCIWLDDRFPGATEGAAHAQQPTRRSGYSQGLYGKGGMVPSLASHQRGIARDATPMIHFRGKEIRAALDAMRGQSADPHEGTMLRFTNPVTGAALFPTLDYTAQSLRPGEETLFKRETASRLYVVLEGRGSTEVGNEQFDWDTNDIFVLPNFLWRRHVNRGPGDAVLYAISDLPLMEKIGQYRAQGRLANGEVVQLVD
jgi:gentisate 1,2-dioxygenase